MILIPAGPPRPLAPGTRRAPGQRMTRIHPLLTRDALPDVVVPRPTPHPVRQFRLPSCIGRAPRAAAAAAPVRIETTRRDPTRTSRWFQEGDALAGPDDDLPDLTDDLDTGRPLAWWLSMAVVVLAAAALIAVICAKAVA